MKSLEELQDLLLHEIQNNLNNEVVSENHDYYNKYTGYISVLLASILEKTLLKNTDWDSSRWIDDSLLTKLKLSDEKLSVWGIMIWGVQNSNEQWTDPFYFEINLNIENGKFNYIFLFGDSDNHEIAYEDFVNNRNYWDFDYYRTNDWNPSDRNWKHIIVK